MKNLILIKQSPTIQLAHLYEHIFCAHISELFRKNGFFPYLDYLLDGKTYHGGVIAISIELYSDTASALSAHFPNSKIAFSEDTIHIALRQLVAEKQEPYSSEGYDSILKALQELDARPWQPIDDVDIIDTKSQRRKAGPLYIVDGAPLRARKLKTSVSLNAKLLATHRHLLPLFRQLAWLIIASFQEDITRSFGFYSIDDSSTLNRNGMTITNTFNVPKMRDLDLDIADVAIICGQIVTNLRRTGAFNRLLGELSTTSYLHRSEIAPNLKHNYEDTLIIIGSKGWSKIATKENCELLLGSMSIEVTFGREKRVVRLRSAL